MQKAKAFFLDLDVGSTPQKYASQAEAQTDLARFCTETELPSPMIVSSGGGLHVYWLIETPIASEEWRTHAHKLRELTNHHGLKADPARTTDTASILRVAGTLNLKHGERRPVEILHLGAVMPTAQFLQLLDDAIVRSGTVLRPLYRGRDELGTNIGTIEFDGPPVSMESLLRACSQIHHQARHPHEQTESSWYHSLQVIRHVENGRHYGHKFSKEYPGYTPAETDRKLDYLEQKHIGPTSCTRMAEVCGDVLCLACSLHGKVAGPISAARFRDPAPAPEVKELIGQETITTVMPSPPFPYMRLKDGAIAVMTGNELKDGDEEQDPLIILSHDLYPIRRLVNIELSTEQHEWMAALPRRGEKQFVLDADALYDVRKLVTGLANNGVFPTHPQLKAVQTYMTAYIRQLQKLIDEDTQANHLGWADNRQSFVLPDKVLKADGSVKHAALSLGAQRASKGVCRKGTLARQIELLGFYNYPEYIDRQFFILAGLGAPLFYATDHHGVLLNASGVTGTSKSSALYTAAAMWGDPKTFTINGTNRGFTANARNGRVASLANLPVCVDEITHMPNQALIDLAMSISQPGDRGRLDSQGVEQAAKGGEKATMMLSSANNSLHEKLSLDNAAASAGSMRVFEMLFCKTSKHTGGQADEFLHELYQNYGHIGETFIAYVIRHEQEIAVHVRRTMREIQTMGELQGGERFWGAAVASSLVAGEIAHDLGLIPYDVAAIRRWALQVQLPFMRGTVVDVYTTPLETLMNYLESIHNNMIVIGTSHPSSNISNYIREPRGELLAHHDEGLRIMWVLKKGFKDYCIRSGASAARIIGELFHAKVIVSKETNKILGAGTVHAKGQSWCFMINMSHPLVAGSDAKPSPPPDPKMPSHLKLIQ